MLSRNSKITIVDVTLMSKQPQASIEFRCKTTVLVFYAFRHSSLSNVVVERIKF